MELYSDLLDTMTVFIEHALRDYEDITGLKFWDVPEMELTPDKPYSARTSVPVAIKSAMVGNLVTLAFAKGDGTGDAKTFKLDDLAIPEALMHQDKPERVLPRAKTGIISEFCFPLFSITPGNWAPYTVALDELGVVNNTIAPIKRLGFDDDQYVKALFDQ